MVSCQIEVAETAAIPIMAAVSLLALTQISSIEGMFHPL